jgi:tetratricopeptide (TPR) repeat protein
VIAAILLSPISPARHLQDYACVARGCRYNQIEQARAGSGQHRSVNGKAKRMNPSSPDWRNLVLDEGILREAIADAGRIVLWLPGVRDASFQYWERIATVARGEISAAEGLRTTAATSIQARQSIGGLMVQLWNRLAGSKRKRDFHLPNGAAAEQCGDRQGDLILVWPEDDRDHLDDARIKVRWPDAGRVQKLGQNLFVVGGLAAQSAISPTGQPSTPTGIAESPRASAEAMLAAARQAGSHEKEATALTDLGAILLNDGDPQGAITSLEQALAIARQIGDTARESDVLGNLGMAMLTVRQPERARELFTQELTHARATNDRFAEKFALERLGIAAWSLRDFNGSLKLLDQALSLALQLGDRHQQANLLWHQGIQYAELGQREPAIAKAEEAVAVFKSLGRPQAATYGAYLQKYRMGLVDESPAFGAEDRSAQAYLGGSMVASVMASQAPAETRSTKGTGGPGLLRMAMSATKAMAGFAGSGFKTTPPEVQRRRLQTCAGCEHHTGVRCKICGCFTNAKSRLLHENCPIGKWPA